jgi:hypothetical protein
MKHLIALLILGLAQLVSAVAVQPEGFGTENDPYLIESLGNLQWVDENESCWSAWFLQTANIDADSTHQWNNGEGWVPIGYEITESDYNHFTGHYEGNYKTIANLFVCRPESDCQGYFGYTEDAEIHNLTLIDVNITGHDSVGGLAGYAVSATIDNCRSTGAAEGSYSVGGLVGFLYESTLTQSSANSEVIATISSGGGMVGYSSYSVIENGHATGGVAAGSDGGGFTGICVYGHINLCFATGDVIGEYAEGGFLGESYQATIERCYATGSATGENQIGGFVGYCNIGSIINDCYASGAAEGYAFTGGLVGELLDGDLAHCYSLGAVPPGYSCGGLVGWNSLGTAVGCYFNTDTAGIYTSAIGGALNTAQLHDLNTYLDGGWDFVGESENGDEDIWMMNASHNDGYPYISGNFTPVDDAATVPPDPLRLKNSPNPFNPSTAIEYSLKSDQYVVLSIYDARGDRVRNLLGERQSPGDHRVAWNGTDDQGRRLASGVYLIRLQAGERVSVRKALLLK